MRRIVHGEHEPEPRRPRWLSLGTVLALEAAGYVFLVAAGVGLVWLHA